MNTLSPPVRLSERHRTLLEMRANGDQWLEIEKALGETMLVLMHQWVDCCKAIGAKSEEHAIALAIRGGHIL